MPLNTKIVRKGKDLKISWGEPELNCMFTAACKEAAPEVEYNDGKTFGDLKEGQFVNLFFLGYGIFYTDWEVPLIRKGEQKLKERHEFKLYKDEPPLVLEPGDVLKAWRTY